MSAGMRVLVTADAVGGVWTYAVDLARALVAHDVTVVLAVLGPSPSAEQQKKVAAIPGLTLVDTGLALDWMAPSPGAVHAAGEAVAALASRHRADLVQLNAPALAATVAFPVPVLAVNHSCLTTWWGVANGGAPEGDYSWRAELTGLGLKAADRVVAPTAAFAEATQRAYGLSVTPTVVHNGRAPLDLPHSATHDYAFTAGRLWDKGKNAATLDRAAEQLSIPFYAAGPVRGPGGDGVVLDHISVLGELDERALSHWLAPRPVFVSAALYEPFGLAVLEAAQAGCPLLLSDIPTFRELWDGAAWFVDPLDHLAFADSVARIAGDAFLRRQRGEAARERAARYTDAAMAKAMASLYAQLAGRAGAVGRAARVAA
ncbi:MAG: glycosyltransferase [Alphaproteobacteria bacterium]|nr:glycosyltransferase [Alphaproteobacteria bacterium]